MAKRNKKENEELLLQSYNAVVRDLRLDRTAPVNNQVHDIIVYADELQDRICKAADRIKIDAYAEVKENWPELGIPKNVWLELVHLRRLQRHTSLSDDYIAKIAMSFEGAKNITAFRSTLLTAIQNNNLDAVEVPTIDTEKQLQFEGTETLQSEFIDLLNECADLRHTIDSQMWTKMRLIGNAFCHLTKEPYGVFKELLDLWHYRNGGWPKPTTPPRIWGTIFRFIHQYDMLDKYGFTMAKDWCARLGLHTERTPMSPTAFTFTEQASRFGKYFMAKLRPDTQMNYPQYRFEPWHHIIGNKDADMFFAYVWDTRVIDFSGKLSDLNICDITTEYADSCEPLQFSDDIVSAVYDNLKIDAEQYIPLALMPISEERQEERQAETLLPLTFEQAVNKRKAELLAQHQTDDELELINDDPFIKYDTQHAHPEIGFDERYAVKWQQGDLCSNEFLGEGRVIGADTETGELIVHFTRYDKEFRAWMWHLTKLEVEPNGQED